MQPTFFATPAEFRDWLAANHDRVAELWVGFHKKGSGKPSISYPEALDEALCFGWIDGVRKSVDDTSYTVRFTPRKPKSAWSRVNLRRFAELEKLGRPRPAGRKAFAERDAARSDAESVRERSGQLDDVHEAQFRARPAAWDFFSAQPPGYRRMAGWWVMSAKQEETRQRRLAQLIAASEKGERVGVVTGKAKKGE